MESERWNEQVFRLPKNHGWTAKPGNKVVVADRGALRFEIPESWIVQPSMKSIKFLDGEPPNDNISLEVSVIYVGTRGMNVDWTGLPLREVIRNVTSDEATGFTPRNRASARKRDRTKVGPPTAIQLGNLEMAWVQTEFVDPVEKRPAFSRMAVTRDHKESIHALLTLSYWPEDAERANGVWNDMLGSLRMGEHFESPFHGPGQ